MVFMCGVDCLDLFSSTVAFWMLENSALLFLLGKLVLVYLITCSCLLLD